MDNTSENNKLIAEFMGYIHNGNHMATMSMALNLKKLYHESWDWLMPVVEKCTQIGFRDQEFDNEIYAKWEEIFDDQGMFLGNHINEVYESVVQFIKWYNEQKDNNNN